MFRSGTNINHKIMNKFIDNLKTMVPSLIVVVTVLSLVLFGYMEYTYYLKAMPNLGTLVHVGVPLSIESIKFVLLLATFTSVQKAYAGGSFISLHSFSVLVGFVTSAFVVHYQYQEVKHMAQTFGSNVVVEDFAMFLVFISIILEIRLSLLLFKA